MRPPAGIIALGVLAASLSGLGCAHSQNKDEAPPFTMPESEPNARSVLTEDEKSQAAIEIGLPGKTELDVPGKIRISLSNARVRLDGATKAGGASITVKLAKGKPTCKTKLAVSPTRLTLVEASATDMGESAGGNGKPGACHYEVKIATPDAGELEVDIRRGSLAVSNWPEPIRVRLRWGEIEFEAIGPLSVDCVECSIDGSGIAGKLRYSVGKGNIGVEGLTGSVDGFTHGDTVLRWKKMNPGSQVSVTSLVGDVILEIPKTVPLALDLRVPKGEIYSRLKPSEVVVNSQELRRGIPLTVVAESGNLRLLH
ncbi:MAG: hypothetical protein HYW49_03850 [Deltaproteobacteria bacterium]|nr:hypothetical protein [Deltaproteobacteria bacterium]